MPVDLKTSLAKETNRLSWIFSLRGAAGDSGEAKIPSNRNRPPAESDLARVSTCWQSGEQDSDTGTKTPG